MSNGSVLTASDSIHVSNESASNLALSRDEWSIIVQNLHIYDTIFVRASSKWLYKLCQQVRPFPRLYVLDQERCTDYIIKNGSLSLLDYVKTVLHFNWTSRHCSTAARFGHVSILKQLRADNCPWNDRTVLADCAQGTCSLDMIKYLHESGVSWQQLTPFHKYNEGYELLVSDMAKHGHIDCIKYAMQNGCKDKYTHYIPTKECLDFVIDNNLDWKGDVDEHRSFAFAQPKSLSLPNICEEAATRGDINMLKYAHQRGALLKTSASRATNVECLAYAVEHGKENELPFQWDVQSVDSFKYLLQKFGVEDMQKKINWHVICRNAELFKFVLDSGFSLPIDNFFVVDMWFSNAAESVESIKVALDHVPAELLKEIDVYSICARRGNLEGMKLAHELKLPMRPRQNGFLSGIPQVMMNAIRSNSVEVLKFVWENLVTNKETELNFNSFLLEAANSTPEIIHYLTEQGAKWTLKHLKEANNSCKLPILAYLMRTGTLKDSLTYDSYNFDSSICKKYVQEHGK